METVSTKQLIQAVGLTSRQFHNLKNRYPERFQPLNPGYRHLQWDPSIIPTLAEMARNLRTYKGRRPQNSVKAGWTKQSAQ